ncbi:MAG: cytidylate kinase-like family protein [bacterium]|nr:cytidylate kinase-like family protein [bacterium]
MWLSILGVLKAFLLRSSCGCDMVKAMATDAVEYKRDKKIPVITISRQSGSGGKLVADMLAKKLGKPWKTYDREILDQIAKVANVREDLLDSLDERTIGLFEQLTRSILGMEYIGRRAFSRHLVQTILAIGHKGHAIILGRGGNFILPWAFNVRIIASFDTRVERMMHYEKMSIEKARASLKEWDAERAEFVREIYSRNIDRPWHYCLMINTDTISVEKAADLITASYKEKFK